MKFTIFIIGFIYSFKLIAMSLDHFQSGNELCQNTPETKEEFSKYTLVPIDYNKRSSKTSIYSYTKKKFNKDLPTILFFTGGPGVSSRQSEFDIKNVNVLFFEQRGISCSIPDDERLFLNPQFYSSSNTANDALLILEHYGIKKATIYGHSYGTIPATIFASLFPQRTSALILEGVVYEANISLWNSKVRLNFFQDIFDSLTPNQQDLIIELGKEKLPKNWFSKMGNMFLYLNNGKILFKNFLDSTLAMDEASLISFASNFFSKVDLNENFYFGNIAMGMIGCQEMSMNNTELSMSLIINKNKKFIFENESEEFQTRCLPLDVTTSKTYFQAINYKLKVPTFYFLGEADGATDIYQGLNHLKNIAGKNGKALILKDGGHLPLLGLLKDNRECNPANEEEKCLELAQNKIAESIIESIAKNQTYNSSQIDLLNSSGELQYYLYQK